MACANFSLQGGQAFDWQQFQTNVSFPPPRLPPQVPLLGSGLRLQETLSPLADKAQQRTAAAFNTN